MKVVNCVHCGTPNVIQEHGFVEARCIKCGNYVELSTTILNLLPTWAVLIIIVGEILLIAALILFVNLSV